MSIFRKILAVFFIVILIPIVFLGSLAIAFISTYLNADFYQSEAFQDAFYNAIVSEVSSELINQNPLIEDFLTQEQIEKELKNVITPEMIGSTIEDLFEQISQKPFPEEIIISTEEFKQNLPLAIDNLLEEIDDPMISSSFDSSMVDYIPHEVPISFANMNNQARLTLALFLANQGTLIKSMVSSWVLFLIIIGALIWKPWASIAAWEGWALSVAGLPVLAFSMLLKRSFQFNQWDVGEINTATVESLLAPFMQNLTIYGLTLIGAGIFAFVLHFVLNAKSHGRA